MNTRRVLILGLALIGAAHAAETPLTHLVLLGTGNPPADPVLSGPATAVLV
jgi:hypothetical protein